MAPATSTSGKDPVPILQEAGWAPGVENLVPTGIRFRTVQPVAQSLYRLSYPAHRFEYVPEVIISDVFLTPLLQH